MIALPTQLCFQPDETSQQPGYHQNQSPTSKETAVGLKSIWTDCPSVALPMACRRTGQTERSCVFLLVKIFHFLSCFECCDLSLGSWTVAPGHCLSHFLWEEKQGLWCTALSCFIQHSLLRLSSSFLGRWILLNISNSPDGNGYRTGSFSVSNFPDFELVCSLLSAHWATTFLTDPHRGTGTP